jgi:hypothetical protein
MLILQAVQGIGARLQRLLGITDFSAGYTGDVYIVHMMLRYIHSLCIIDTAAAAKNNYQLQSRNDIVFTYGGTIQMSLETMRLTDGPSRDWHYEPAYEICGQQWWC